MSKKQRAALIAALDALSPNVPRVLLATGELFGEGFDHPPLDTLVLAMPVAWKGTLAQYAGRLHRDAILAGYRDLAAGRVFASSGDFKTDMAVLDRKEADGWQ